MPVMRPVDYVDEWNKYIGLEMALRRALGEGVRWREHGGCRYHPSKFVFDSFCAEQRERLRGDIALRDHGDRREVEGGHPERQMVALAHRYHHAAGGHRHRHEAARLDVRLVGAALHAVLAPASSLLIREAPSGHTVDVLDRVDLPGPVRLLEHGAAPGDLGSA